MALENQHVTCKTIDDFHHYPFMDSQTGEYTEAISIRADKKELRIENEDTEECFQCVPINSKEQTYSDTPQNVSLLSTPSHYNSYAPFQQVFKLTPTFLNYYYGSHASASGNNSGCSSNNHLTPGFLQPPGFPQLPSVPGFLTGAGYHFSFTGSPVLGGLRVPGSPLLPPCQAGTSLHAAAVVGDKLKLTDILQDKSTNLEARDRWGRVALIYAVLGNHQEAVETLLRSGARPDATDSYCRTALHFAAYKGHLGCIKAILHAVESKGISHLESQGGVWLAQDVGGVTPLHHAAIHSNHKCLQALLKYAAPGTLDTEDHKKRTPLHWAAAYGSEENVRLLIKHGANNLMPDQEGKTPLHWAAMSKAEGAKDCVRTLICAAPSSVNWQDFDGITALHLAVAEARKDTVDVILSVQKCNVDLTDNQFRTALHWACNRGLTAIVGCLLERGAHLGAVDVYGATPLHYAAQLNHDDTVELLVRRPCVRDDPSKEGYTALLWAAAQGADSAITVMVRHGASLTEADPRGCTALHIAAGAGHVSTVGVLLRLRAPPDVCANDGRTPLLHAAQAGHAQIVKILAKAGASLDHRDNEGQCALHHAVLGGHLYLAQILIRAGTSVNVQDYSGRTPLHMAAYRGLSDIMFLLLENRGDVNARDHQGQSPLHWAAQQGHLGAVNTLLDFHAYPNYTQTTVDRYTPLDCADVAEQFEVAQVLMEAGGLSVTRIMNVAATRLQAVVRGFLARKHFTALKKSWNNQRGIDNPDEACRTASFFHSFCKDMRQQISSPQSIAAEGIGHNYVCESSVKNSTIKDVCRKLDKEILLGSDSKVCSPVPHQVQGTLCECNLYNSISGQRRSKALASHIKRGARRKTLRNLELPGLGELGISQMKAEEMSEDGEGSDTEYHYTPLTHAVQDSSLALAQALQYSGNVASIVVTAGISISQQDMCVTDNDHLSKRKTPEEGNKSQNRKSTECQRTEYDVQNQVGQVQFQKNEIKNTAEECKDVVTDACESNESGKGNAYLPNRNCKEKSYAASSVKSEKKHDTAKDSEDFKDYPAVPLSYLHNVNREKYLEPNMLERRRVHQEKSDKSLRTAGKLYVSQKYMAVRQSDKTTMTAETRKLAEERWNNKLASLTLQTVQRPNIDKAGVTGSYKLGPSVAAVPVTGTKKNTPLLKKDIYFDP
ncbi:uncharacterized protein [Panulirus ornatus]|uniref:uncharacterized protein isoform X1 n=1 Tax=Panulirus ornatus TaxID=150431 RepID=UPI003A8A1EE2